MLNFSMFLTIPSTIEFFHLQIFRNEKKKTVIEYGFLYPLYILMP